MAECRSSTYGLNTSPPITSLEHPQLTHLKTLKQLSQALHQRQISSLELTQYYLQRIKAFDSKINSFISITSEQALEAAAEADVKLDAGSSSSPLTGIPIAHKDIFCTKGVRTSCGSKMLDNFTSPYDATLVKQLSDAGSILLGKTNMDEFAMGSSNETSYYGAVRNPWDTTCVPGGSSGGSAAAIAARLVPAATGTDTGGSIRQPSSLCGVTGIKPTYGRVSRYGMIAFASSLDQAGVIATTAEDCALLLEYMSGYDPMDSTSINKPVPEYSKHLYTLPKKVKIGIPREFFNEALEPGNAQSVQVALAELEKQGAELIDINLPNSHLSIPTYHVIASAECSSNLARYDGVRYGHRCDNAVDLYDMYRRTRGEGFGNEVKRRILVGTYVLSSGYYDAYYLKAKAVRRLINDDFLEAFQQVDIIAGPSCPGKAFKLGHKCDDPLTMYLEDMYTIGANLSGLPALSVPCGFSDGKPVGLQFIGKHFGEQQILSLAHRYQQISDWHLQIPNAFT